MLFLFVDSNFSKRNGHENNLIKIYKSILFCNGNSINDKKFKYYRALNLILNKKISNNLKTTRYKKFKILFFIYLIVMRNSRKSINS